jgi:hypothetical protein
MKQQPAQVNPNMGLACPFLWMAVGDQETASRLAADRRYSAQPFLKTSTRWLLDWLRAIWIR